MSAHGQPKPKAVLIRLGGLVVLLAAAAVAGWLLGKKSLPVIEERPEHGRANVTEANIQKPDAPKPSPLFFSLSIPAGASQSVAAEEVKMAAAVGIHQYVLALPLPWEGDMNVFLEPLNVLMQSDPEARVMFRVALDPPTAWLEAHPDDTVKAGEKQIPFVSLASEVWKQEAKSKLEAFLSAVTASVTRDRVLGFVLGALEAGAWHRPEGIDRSPANAAGFRHWLREHYSDENRLKEEWGDPNATFDGAGIPEMPAQTGCESFLKMPGMRRVSDFLEYTSEATAGTIEEFASFIKGLGKEDIKVYCLYGYSYELVSKEAGHFALSRLLEGPVDGFVSPVSYVDRGLGGTGGMMGPLDSAKAHGKQWFILDDTRTGLERDPSTGEVARPKNIRAEDIYRVQQRNFSLALCHGAGVFWCDPNGEGWLHDADMWQRFGKMWTVYRDYSRWLEVGGPATADPTPTLAVVVDESSRFLQQCDAKLNDVLLHQLRDTVLRAGVPTKFYLLRDVIEGKVPKAQGYLFLNTFRLTAEDRQRLHEVLKQNSATAIWMYAPGYFDQQASVDNIAATTRIKVKQFEGPAQAGSKFALPGRWVGKDEVFGVPLEINPLFYIEDDSTDVLAQFSSSEKPSIAVSFFQEGWSSVFCAEPGLTPAVLRELLGILELHVYYREMPAPRYDVVHFGPGLMAIHGMDSGERIIDLTQPCDIQDLFAPEVGWQLKMSFNLPLTTGDARLLKLTPVTETQSP